MSKYSNIDTIAKNYCDRIGTTSFYRSLFKNVQKICALKNLDIFNFENSIIAAIRESGLENDLRNDIYYWIKEQNLLRNGISYNVEKELFDFLNNAEIQWEKRICKSINSMCTELSVPLYIIRSPADRDEILEKWSMLSTYNIDLSQYRPVYAPKDFLEVLLNMQNVNQDKLNFENNKLNSIRISLKVKSLMELKEMYSSIVETETLLGMNYSSTVCKTLAESRIHKGDTVLEFNNAAVTQEYLKNLAPHCLRSRLWAQVLGSIIFPWQQEYFQNLKQMVGKYDILVDKLIFKDIQLTVCNDDQYFVFEDLLYQVMLCLSRDAVVASLFQSNNSNPIAEIIKVNSNSVTDADIFPPNSVIPFHGFSMYAAPLCYVYNDPEQLYFSVRSFYIRYWFRLHEINSHPQGILSLCILFQQLLQYNEPQLFSHFNSINVQPIKVVFKWLMRCFSGHLPPEQLLYLWDIILGYDSLEIIPLLAVAILSFRKESLLQVYSLQSIEAVLADLSSIQIIPLLQFVFMSE